MHELVKISEHLTDPIHCPAVLATLIAVQGSSYRRVGARLLLTSQGERIGSISGGCLEEDLLLRMQALRQSSGPAEVVVYDTTEENETVWGVGMGCHGVVHVRLQRITAPPAWAAEVLRAQRTRQSVSIATDGEGDATGTFVQLFVPEPHLVVFGAGDDARPLLDLAKTLHWRVTICDPRPALVTAERFPGADEHLAATGAEAVSRITWDDRTVAVVMTHHYRYDLPLLRALLPLHLPYLGVLGPRQRGERLVRDALGAAATESSLEDVFSPVGLDLGGDGAGAVALAIVAEIQSVLHGRSARPLRHRSQPIHAG